MLNGAFGASGALASTDLTSGLIAYFGFLERAQAFHEGVVAMIEAGNPLAAATLLRSFAENTAAVYYIDEHPQQVEKLELGAKQGLAIGKVVAAAEKSLPGFKSIYAQLSSMAHPSGAGSFHTMRVADDDERIVTWQSAPTFRTLDDARELLDLLAGLRSITTQIISATGTANLGPTTDDEKAYSTAVNGASGGA